MSIKGFQIDGAVQRYDYTALDNKPVADATLSVSGGFADAKAVGDAVNGLNERLEELGDGVPTEVRQALLTLFQSAAYAETGLADEVAVIASWAAVVTAISLNQSSISISGASTSQLVATTTPAGGAVTWASSDTSVATVSSSGLVTGVGNGTATITASCGGKKATCSVTVSGFASLTGITATYTQSGTVYNTDTLDSLKSDLVVTANYSDSTTRTLSDSDYTLSGTLEVGTSTITVTYGGESATFSVHVTDINALNVTYAQGSIGGGNTDANRVSCVIMSDVHFDDGETVVVTFPEGYQIFPFSAVANSNKSLAGTRSGTNSLYAYIVSDSGYVTPTNQGTGGSLLVNGGSLKQWVTTSPATYSFTKIQEYGHTYTGIGFVVKKTDESTITPSDIEQVVTIEKVEVQA